MVLLIVKNSGTTDYVSVNNRNFVALLANQARQKFQLLWGEYWRTDNLTNNRRLFNRDNRRIETHQSLITSLHSQ